MPCGLATGLLDLVFGPGRRAVAATAGVLQRRPARAHAQRRRLRTTRAAARPSEEQEDEQRHADATAPKERKKENGQPKEGMGGRHAATTLHTGILRRGV